MHKSLEEKKKDIIKKHDAMHDLEIEHLEMKRLKQAKENAQQRLEETVTLQDLFSKNDYGLICA